MIKINIFVLSIIFSMFSNTLLFKNTPYFREQFTFIDKLIDLPFVRHFNFMVEKLKYNIGDRYDKLVILKGVTDAKVGKSMVLCRCDCGLESVRVLRNLLLGVIPRCSCFIKKTKAQSDHNWWFNKKRKKILLVIEDLPNEEWVDVKGYESIYSISNKGRVKSLKRTCIRNGLVYEMDEKLISINNKRYKNVILCKKSIKKDKLVHRLIAEAFIPNPYKKPFVNHIDGNKYNNSLDNLEWCTHKENQRHAVETGLIQTKGGSHPLSKRIGMFDKDGSLIEEFEYMKDVTNRLGFRTLNLIRKVAIGERETAYGYKWKYL